MHDNIESRLTALLCDQLKISLDTPPTPESRLADLGLDSLRKLSFVAAIEREFDLEITDDDLPRLETVGGIVSLIRDHGI